MASRSLARPIGSVLFGHFGDRVGRKSTLVARLLTMGLSATLIGSLPNYNRIGIAAPLLLCVLRLVQGVGLDGERGGPDRHGECARTKPGLFGMFPQLGSPLGFLLANGLFLGLLLRLDETSFLVWGWRIPFLVTLVLVGLSLKQRRLGAQS